MLCVCQALCSLVTNILCSAYLLCYLYVYHCLRFLFPFSVLIIAYVLVLSLSRSLTLCCETFSVFLAFSACLSRVHVHTSRDSLPVTQAGQSLVCNCLYNFCLSSHPIVYDLQCSVLTGNMYSVWWDKSHVTHWMTTESLSVSSCYVLYIYCGLPGTLVTKTMIVQRQDNDTPARSSLLSVLSQCLHRYRAEPAWHDAASLHPFLDR